MNKKFYEGENEGIKYIVDERLIQEGNFNRDGC